MRITPICLTIVLLGSSMLLSQEVESFEQARTLSLQTGKPLLLEFFHDD